MESSVLDAALSQGIWAVLAVFLLIYIVKSNERFSARQEEREKQYQELLSALTEKDRTLLWTLAEETNMLHVLDFKSRVYLQSIPNLDKNLYAVIENTERKLPEID